jgi:hypothetical protein
MQNGIILPKLLKIYDKVLLPPPPLLIFWDKKNAFLKTLSWICYYMHFKYTMELRHEVLLWDSTYIYNLIIKTVLGNGHDFTFMEILEGISIL